MAYNDIQGRADLTDVLLPDQIIKEIIAEAPKASVLLSRAKKVRLSAKKAKQPVLATLPEAYWVNGDQIIKEIIAEAPKASVLLSRAKKVRLSAKKAKQPVLATLPEAYWVNGDTKEIIAEAPKSSVLLSRAKKVRLSAKKAKQPVLATLPEAYWVNGDTGLKQTTKSTWKNINITAEELAVIVPIPDALLDDADVPLWDEVKPLLVEAIGK